jgi:hypothetical protein
METEAPDVPEVSEPATAFVAEPSLQVVPVEFVIDSHRITAEIQHPGAPRRLVDYLNAVDGPRISLHNGSVGGGRNPDDSHRFQIAQIFRNAVLIAIPRGNTTFTARSLEIVPKRPVPAVLVLPGYDVAGNIYMVPEIDPSSTPLIGGHQFVPVTHARITPAGDPGGAWEEPLVVVNMARTLLYAPQ